MTYVELSGCNCTRCVNTRNDRENTNKEESNMSDVITEVTAQDVPIDARVTRLAEMLVINDTNVSIKHNGGEPQFAAVGSLILSKFDPTRPMSSAELDTHEALVEANKVIYTHYNARRSAEESLSKAFVAHRGDIQLIGDRLNEEANSRGWCSEFDSAITDLNGALSIALDSREVEKEFLVEGYIRVPFTHYFTATVNPGDSSYDQQAAAQEMWESNYGTRDVQTSERDAEFEDGSIEVSIND